MTDTITLPRHLANEILEFLQFSAVRHPVVDELAAALAAPPKLIKEVVVNADYRTMWAEQVKLNQRLTSALAAPQPVQEPVGYVDKRIPGDVRWKEWAVLDDGAAIYAAPVQPVPLFGSPGKVGSNDPRTDYRTNSDLPSQAASPPDPQLCKFYGVETYPALVEAQARHIEKVQAKLPNTTGTFTVQKVREG